MKLEDQVCSLELAKKLKELGVKQESLFWWNHGTVETSDRLPIGEQWALGSIGSNRREKTCAAFTVAELGEMIPTTIDNKYDDKTMWLYMRNMHHSGQLPSSACVWYANGRGEETVFISEPTEADARAKMLIYLIENKLVKP